MSTDYALGGRSAQKRRTRAALVAAARDLVATGVTPTVEEAAQQASVSRTTAYRYFPNQRALLMAAHPETAATSLLPADAGLDVASRLDAVVRAFSDIVLATETQQRTMLRLSLEADESERAALPLRQGRAIRWIDEAVAPLRAELPDVVVDQLVRAVRSAVGIEALAWLTDIGGLSRADAVALMRWSAQAMLSAAGSAPPPTPARRRRQEAPVERRG